MIIASPRPRILAAMICLSFLALSPGAATAQQDDVWKYAVQPGESIWSISQRLLVDWRRWKALQALNAIEQPRSIPPGTLIDVPMDWLRLAPVPARIEEVTGEVAVERGARSCRRCRAAS